MADERTTARRTPFAPTATESEAGSPGPLVIDVTAIGTVKRRQALTRGGARPGDAVFVSGSIGGAAAGLGVAKAVFSRTSSVVNRAPEVVSQWS